MLRLWSRDVGNLAVAGASFSRYKVPPNFTAAEFDYFVELIDEQLLQSSSELLEGFYIKLQDRNSKEGIEADYSYAFRLMEATKGIRL
jgi:hypothetical protein